MLEIVSVDILSIFGHTIGSTGNAVKNGRAAIYYKLIITFSRRKHLSSSLQLVELPFILSSRLYATDIKIIANVQKK